MRKLVTEKKFQTPVITPSLAHREMQRTMKEFEVRLNEEHGLSTALRKPRGVELSSEEVIAAMQRKEHLPAQHETVDGKRYVRLCDWGNPAAEALVRTNLEQFISEVRQVIKNALSEKKLGRLLDMCLDYEDGGLKLAGFFTKSGTPLGRNRAFSEAIKQFFKDDMLVLKIVDVCVREHEKEARRSAVPIIGNVSA